MIEAKEYFRKCKHFTQIDPGNPLTGKTLDAILVGDTDAVIVAGTQGVTETYAIQAVDKISVTDKPIYFAPSHPLQVGKSIMNRIKNGKIYGMIIYNPLNSKNPDVVSWPGNWRSGLSLEIRYMLDDVIDVGYIVTNPKSTVGKLVNPNLSEFDIATSVKNSSFKEFYLDGSGELVSTKLIAKVKEQIWDRHGFLLVGGGINTTSKAYSAMNNGANAVNVGTVLEKGNLAGYKETINAAKEYKK